jgi:hypothetical protein
MKPTVSSSRTSSPRNGLAVIAGGAQQSTAKLGVSKDGGVARPSSAAILRDASLEPVIGRAFARPVDDAPQDEVGENSDMTRTLEKLIQFNRNIGSASRWI